MAAVGQGGVVARINDALRRLPVWPLYPLAFLPAASWLWMAAEGRLGADPVKALEHEYGLLALQFLVAALAVTPLRELTRVSLVRFRRWMGLMGFWYALMHFAVWLVLDRQLDWPRVVEDLTRRPYVVIGFVALALLVPLAATSWNGAVRRMGATAWRRLHRLAYPATALAAIHFVWLVKAWPPEPLAYAAAVAALLGYRAARGLRRPAGRAATGGRA